MINLDAEGDGFTAFQSRRLVCMTGAAFLDLLRKMPEFARAMGLPRQGIVLGTLLKLAAILKTLDAVRSHFHQSISKVRVSLSSIRALGIGYVAKFSDEHLSHGTGYGP